MNKKLKKLLKKVGKAALIGGAGYAAIKGLGKKKSDGFLSSGAAGGARLPKGDRSARAIKAMTSNDAYNDDSMPMNLSKNMGQKRKEFMPGIVDYMAKGGRAGYKSGGSTGSSKASGCAIRGKSSILLKGKR